MLNKERGSLEAKANQLEQIKNVEKALQNLDSNYFHFDKSNKRYKLALDVRFNRNSAKITDISANQRRKLKEAGYELYRTVARVTEENPNINYLLIIEGNTQRSSDNWINSPNIGYRLSYNRALALYNFWKDNGIDFRKFNEKCEVIIAGSGYFSQSRDMKNEESNRRFSIQITSKVAQFLDKNSNKNEND
jgi:outer membrane protein OmpA-like peptidoglycan-associated protein